MAFPAGRSCLPGARCRRLVPGTAAGAIRLLLPLLLAATLSGCGRRSDPTPAPGDFTGSSDCRECHAPFYAKWSTSFHGLAMRPFTASFASEHLAPQPHSLAIAGRSYQAEPSPEGYAIRESSPAGTNRLPISQVLGGKNVFYFLTPRSGGRLQVLPLAFDVRRKEWYDTTASMVRHLHGTTDAPLDWTDRRLTFNASCYTCHVSQLAKNYSVEKDEYTTTWFEPGINCESCHGPGRKHSDSMRSARGAKVPDVGLLVIRDFPADRVNSLCGPCHAKMSPLDPSYQPGGRFFDHYNLFTLEDRDFYPDGRDLGENFTYTQWLMSPCAASGKLDCMHCHTSSGRNKFPGAEADKACLPCHERHVKDPAAHSRHAAASTGSRCVACHMPETSFARMRRHDHSMLAPSPSSTAKFGSPNACSICHSDRDAAWADRWVRKWYARDYQAPILARAGLVDAARREDWTQLPRMVAYILDKGSDDVFTVSLLRLLEHCPNPGKWPAFRGAASDPSPFVRAAAVAGLGTAPLAEDTVLAARAALDEYRLVRVQAAATLSGRNLDPLDPALRHAVASALAEYGASLKCSPDDPRSHYNLGNHHQQQGDAAAARREYEIALRQLPSFVEALVNVSTVYARLGDPGSAERSLREAMRYEPSSNEARFNLALLLAEQQRPGEAEQLLRAVLSTPRPFPEAAYNLGVMLAENNPSESISWCRKAVEWRPDDPKYSYTLAFYLNRGGDRAGAISVLESLVSRHRGYVDGVALLGSLYEESGSQSKASRLYRSAAGWSELDEESRRAFAARAAAPQPR
jgi:tetratricopeptide (TPR) repeat protein